MSTLEFPPGARSAILTWYAATARPLPFRGTTDPYAILVSEAMAQQTQVARVGEAWSLFIARFPTVETLAAASPADVLRAWRGLGYNRRALALWRAARTILVDHGGEVPSDLVALEALPGVGPYTARAVAAIAFGSPVGAVDTNVRRVLGRIVGGESGSLGRNDLQRLADAAVPAEAAAAWTHAVMDLGATVCRPVRPACDVCPARTWCRFLRCGPSEPGGVGAKARTTSAAAQPRTTSAAAQPGTTSAAAQPGTTSAARPFPSTSRWLRGRIVDRLRGAPDGTWLVLGPTIGSHGPEHVEVALRALAREGMLELEEREDGRLHARLPLA